MNALRNRWRSGLAGKLVIVAGFVFLCAACGLVALLLPERDQGAAETAELVEASTPPSAPTATKRPVVATATARPTDTPAPTATPMDTPTPMTPEEALLAGILAELGEGNRNVSRVKNVLLADDGSVSVSWSINDYYTAGFMRSGARSEVVDILQAVRASGIPFNRVDLAGTFSMRDVYGNTNESIVISASYEAATVDRLNLDNVLLETTIYEAADSIKVHPEFLGE